jgi:hypothetical protein
MIKSKTTTNKDIDLKLGKNIKLNVLFLKTYFYIYITM